ncbi:glycoside hydrolase family 88 protein [Paenibacillus roseipurpureus]|uniref:Glycoside hydrolase family 88 protein n=1 Tax=Paenibacillus roseopurpureus TaxID=2918901 RepID=A0AA96RM32_9BACL|nr:glycoside hydrolase family 88 protein [Paenibacillus sp. MBLB1832]WNR46041.1 glycoside hydrolase family 88 protein [Paenibacillus sp. MBLB1832]
MINWRQELETYVKLVRIPCTEAGYADEEKSGEAGHHGDLQLWEQVGKRKVGWLSFDLQLLKGKVIRRAYLRLVNGAGHAWDATAEVTVSAARPQSSETRSSQEAISQQLSITQRVFRVPEWQPGWFIDITDIAEGWMNGKIPNEGLHLQGGCEYSPLFIKAGTEYEGLNPMLVIVCSYTKQGSGALTDRQKQNFALEALSQLYLVRDISWSGSFVRNAQAQADAWGWGIEYRRALQTYFDFCITEDGKFRNVSEEYFYVGACGQALIHLHAATGLAKYRTALQQLRDGIHALPRSQEGIITAHDRVEIELIFCVCAFLAYYHDACNDRSSLDLAIDQTIAIYDVMVLDQPDGIPLQNSNRPGSKGWSRGMGWTMAGMGKLLASTGVRRHRRYGELCERFIQLSHALKPMQTPGGMWRSIVHFQHRPEEVTGTALIALGYEYGFQQGVLDASYARCVDDALQGITKYTRTGIDMRACFPMNFHEKYEVTDFSGNSDQGYGAWMELLVCVMNR